MTNENAATANNTGLLVERRTVDRRAFLAATATAPFATPSLAAPYDPMPSWIAERDRLEDEWMKHPDDTPEGAAIWDELKVYENRILDTPAVTVEGFKAQMRFAVETIAKDYCEDRMTRRILKSLHRGSEDLA